MSRTDSKSRKETVQVASLTGASKRDRYASVEKIPKKKLKMGTEGKSTPTRTSRTPFDHLRT